MLQANIEIKRNDAGDHFRNPANRSLPQLEYRRGTSPNQAAAIGVHYERQLPVSQIVILTVRSWPKLAGRYARSLTSSVR